MEVTVIGKHMDITDPIRAYAQEKSARLARFYDRLGHVEVVADRHDSHSFRIEVIAHVPGHDRLVASGTGDDLYACIDDTLGKMERQLHDHKEKRRNHKH